MSKSATEQFQIKKKRKHPLSVTSTAPINRTYKRNVLHTVSSTAATTATAADLLIKENFAKFQIDTKETAKFNSLLQIKSLAGAVAAATAAAPFDNLSDSKKCIITTPAAATTLSANTVSTLAAVKNCLRDQSQVLILNSPPVNMPLSHKFYVKGALATKRGLKDLKTNAASGSASLASCEAAKRPRKSNENLKLCSPSVMAGQKTTTANNLQLSYMLGESLARHGRLQEAFDIYALIASEQPEGFIPLEKLNILATALLEHIRILSSNSKKSQELLATEPVKGLSNEQQQQLVTPIRSKYASASASAALNWPFPVMSLNAQSSKLKDLGTEYLATAVGGNLDLHSPTRELAAVNDTITLDDFDPLMCPLCRDVLRCPVTTNCGHTFCRQCCETITMCNICHIKFPRWQKDDSSTNINGNITSNGNNYSLNHKLQNMTTTLATLSRATTTTTSIDLTTTTQSPLTFNQQQIYSSTSSFTNNTPVPPISAFTPSNSTPTSSISSSTVSTPLAAISGMPRLQLITTPLPTPTTVTTTTIACTTDTATTTMASTASTSGVELRSTTSNDNMKFMPDVLVRRLVEKWWGADLQAKKINETATSYMHLNLLDDALKFCNASLEKSPTNFKSLLLRAEVLRKMNHQQSSLADVDNALKTRYTSAKAHYIRALALSDLSRYEEALYETCLAIGMDKSSNLSNTELFQHDLTKILQKLLSQTPKCLKVDLSSLRSKAPYSVYTEQRLRHKNISLLNRNTVQEDDCLNLYEDDDFLSANYGQECDILADEDMLVCADFLNCADKRTTYASIAKKYELELKRQTTRKHFRRKWMQKETELLPPNDVESARCSSQFRNVLERMQQEIVRLKKIESSPEYLQRQQVSVNPSLIDASDFDCVLCCRTFWKPVVTPCGHTYCLVCLDRCMDYTSSCPLCMSPLVEPSLNIYQQGAASPVPLMLTKRSVTKFLEAAMKRFIPDSYNKRFRQEMVMEPSVPIFICTTAFPYVPCPLFVYEPRYRLMVRRAVESGDKQFGIVQPHSGKSRYYDYGCILDIRDCVLLGDGCSILSTIGCKRFKILARNEKDGYETAKVEYIHDETIPDEHLSYVGHMHDVVLSKAKQWYQSLGEDLKHEILQSYGEMPVVEDNWETIADGPAWAWWIIALLPLRPQLKVDILATTSLEKRLRAIEKTIHSMPGNCHYQTVTQNCDVTVVVQHHNHNANENVQDHHHLHHHHHRHPNVEDDDENNLSHNGVDGEDDIVLDEEQNLLEHHLVNENIEQQHAAHMPLEQQQQQMHQHQCENVTTVDECCQRTNANAYENDELDLESETHDTSTIPHRHHHHQHQHHHNHHHRQQRHHRTGHTHTLLL